MKFHEGFCQSQPCQKEHRYRCANCDEIFLATSTDHYTPEFSHTLPTRWWPACSQLCSFELLGPIQQPMDPDVAISYVIDEGDLHD